MRDVIIVGGGAAGLSAAAYALDKRLDVLVISENISGKAGWQRRVAGQQGGEPSIGELTVRLFADQVTSHVDQTMRDTVKSIASAGGVLSVETTRHGVQRAGAVIVATGVAPIPLDVPGADELLGYGLGYSAVTHAQLLAGKTVAALGSTPRALRGVHELSRIADKVYWIVENTIRLVSPLGIALQYRPNIEVFQGYRIAKIEGSFHVDAIEVERGNETQRLVVDAAFVDLGVRPHADFLKKLVRTDRGGFIAVDEFGATSLPGLYAAGDVTTAFSEQLLVAVGQGARAALSAYEYLLAHPSGRAHHGEAR